MRRITRIGVGIAVAVMSFTAQAAEPAGWTPVLYVFEDGKLIDVKPFLIQDKDECERRAPKIQQIFLDHSDIQDNQSLIVVCVPVPAASLSHHKGERST